MVDLSGGIGLHLGLGFRRDKWKGRFHLLF